MNKIQSNIKYVSELDLIVRGESDKTLIESTRLELTKKNETFKLGKKSVERTCNACL